MAGLDVDTSSYPKAQLPVQKSPLEIVGQLGALQQQSLGINQQKLDQANQGLTYMSRALGEIGPNGTPQQYQQAGIDAVKQGLVPPNMLHVWQDKLQSYNTPNGFNSKGFYDEFMTAAADHQQQIQYHLGNPGLVNRGSDVVPVRTPQSTGLPVQTGKPIAIGTSPEFNQAPATIYDPKSGQNKQGTQGQYVTNAGVKPLNQNIYQPPAAQPNAAATAPNAPPLNAGPAVAQYSKELTEAPGLLDATKPIAQALPLLTQLGTTGVGTEQGQKIISGLVNAGFISPESKAGKYAVNWQIVNKKLSQFVQSTPIGQRSDAAQTLTEASSPNLKNQLNPALIHLAQDAVATNNMRADRAMSFKNDPEYQGNQTAYPEYAAKRAAEQNPDAYKLYTYPPEQRSQIYADMLKKADNGDKQAQRYIKSLVAAKKAGVLHEGP